MIDVRLYSFLILILFIVVLGVGYGMIVFLQPKIDGVSSPNKLFFYYLILTGILFFVLLTVGIFVRSKAFYKPVPIKLSNAITKILENPQTQNNLRGVIEGSIVPPSSPAPSPTPSLPMMPPPPVSSNSSEKPPTTSYYGYNPNTKSLDLINLDNLTLGKQILDTYHRNDESIFVLYDGIISVLGDEINRYTQGLPIKKVRISNNEYIGLANGKIYKSKDLANWVLDSSKPTNILDIDVPFQQDQILFIQTPSENLIVDNKTNQILAKEASESRKYGSNLNNYLRRTNDGIYIVQDGMQSLYKGYSFGDVSNQNRFLIVPNNLKDGYKVVDSMNLDDKLLVKIETLTDKPDNKIMVKDLVYQ